MKANDLLRIPAMVLLVMLLGSCGPPEGGYVDRGKTYPLKGDPPGNTVVPATTSEQAFDEYQSADEGGIRILLKTGKLMSAKPGDLIFVTEVQPFAGRVQGTMASGGLEGRRVWVPMKCIQGGR